MNKLFCGIDLGTRSSSICIVNEKKELIHRWSGQNSGLCVEIAKLRGNGVMYCVIGSGPLAESISRNVEGVGAHIEIVDSRHTKALLHGKKKTDRIDAHVLAELACMGWYKPIYRKDGKVREQRVIVHGRARLVKVCTQLKNTIRGLLKSLGIVLPVGSDGEKFSECVNEAIQELSPDVQFSISSMRETRTKLDG